MRLLRAGQGSARPLNCGVRPPMKRLAIVLSLTAAVGVAACSGYWLGFRHAWEMGLQADAPARGSLALGQLKMLETGRTSDLRTFFESDIDSGLLWWDQLEAYPLFGWINVLSGYDLLPDQVRFVRRIATYRKDHPSPLREPALIQQMLDSTRQKDPAFAAELEVSGREGDEAIDRMIRKYGQ
jgi:hypothetical protein